MNWILAAFLMFASSIPAYLLIRKATLVGMPLSVQNLACFFVPFLLYLPLAIFSGTSLSVTSYQLVILVVSAVLFSYLGAKFSLLSMRYAPNPGYSLVISKSYVVFTTLFALIFFHATLSFRAAIGVIFITAFSAIILVDPKKNQLKHARPVWLPLTIATFFCWGMLAIASKYLLEIGVPIYTRLIYMLAIVSVIIAADMKKEQVTILRMSLKYWFLFVSIGVLFTGFNYFMQLGYQLAPNIGYINAINASSIAFVTLGASIYFGDEFSWRKFIGVIGVIIGLILLVI